MPLSRRTFLTASTLSASTLLLGAETTSRVALTPTSLAPTPLPLATPLAKLDGLSEKLITSHYENNYKGAVKRLGLITQQISELSSQTPPPYLRGSLARESLIATNSMILHELYFENLGSEGSLHGDLAHALEESFGLIENWSKDFKLLASSLAGGSGWVVLSYCARTKTLINVRAENHIEGLSTGIPLLVCDMYEHAYHIDFGANAKGYIEAFMKNLNYTTASKRFGQIKL